MVDFSGILSSSTEDLGSCPQVKELHSALSTVGFVFLRNHGIDKQLVRDPSSIHINSNTFIF